jgi:hypothetical protein
MSYQEVLSKCAIAVSASDSPDMPALGLSHQHLQDALSEITRHLLALGARLYYGGDLRVGGFSELLFELVQRHKRDASDGDKRSDVINFLAWPVHLRMAFPDIEAAKKDLEGIAELVCLDEGGQQLSLADRARIASRQPSELEWAAGLTAMRKVVLSETQARVVIGGQVEGYKGAMPGIAEEALLSLLEEKPLYLVGGFGGCSRDIAETLGLTEPWAPLNRQWHARAQFNQFSVDNLCNGLTAEENSVLARTPHVDQAIVLILKGLMALTNGYSEG